MLVESANVRVQSEGRVATLWLDFPGPLANLLNPARLAEIDHVLAIVERQSAIEVLVIRSAKSAGFCAGYEPQALEHLNCEESIREFAWHGQQVTERLATAPYLTLALLEGPVLGPGLELALACDYRLAVAAPMTRLGFPDLPHGLVPCWGGLTRLARRLGATKAMEFLTRPGPMSAGEAQRTGLVDRVCEPSVRNVAVRTFSDSLRPRRAGWRTPLDAWAARRVVAAYRQYLEAAPPALAAAIRVIPCALDEASVGLRAERTAFADALGPSRAMLSLRRDEWRLNAVAATPIATVAMLGPVESAEEILTRLQYLGGSVTVVAIDDPPAATSSFDLVLLSNDSARCVEFAESLAKPWAPVAVVDGNPRVAAGYAERPQRFAGLYAVAGSNLVEVVPESDLSNMASDRLRAWLAWLGFTPLVFSGRRGSLVRALRAAWWDEAVRLVSEGLPIHLVDAAAIDLGASTGPLTMLDGLGLDSAARDVPRLRPLLEAGIRGRPHRDGFYVLDDSDPTRINTIAQLVLLESSRAPNMDYLNQPVDCRVAQDHCAERLAARLTVAALRRLGEDGGTDPAVIDIAVTRGLGVFARDGGVLRRAERIGLRKIHAHLRDLSARCGSRFKPPAELTRRALAGENFHALSQPTTSLRMSA